MRGLGVLGIAVLGIVALLAGCAASGPAPVTGPGQRPQATRLGVPAVAATPRIEPSTTGTHKVAKGDTLFAIAFANGLDYRELAIWNQLDDPGRIEIGQVLRLTAPDTGVEVRPLASALPIEARPLDAPEGVPLDSPDVAPAVAAGPPRVTEPQGLLLAYSEASWKQVNAPVQRARLLPARPPASAPTVVAVAPPTVTPPTVTPAAPSSPSPAASATGWLWPADGTLSARFGAAGGKGIDISGARNTEVRAAAAGKVVYSGTGLRGYGRLLIVKHEGDFLSAYAHNESVLVKEGESVRAGQVIARMGDSDASSVKLHFEIRRYGKPLDPLAYLPERP